MTGTWGHAGTRFRVRDGWSNAGREGEAFSYFIDNKNQLWVVIQYDGEEDPDLYKAAGIEIRRLGSANWEDVK